MVKTTSNISLGAVVGPTTWGTDDQIASVGRPAPWAQPPPGKVVPEPVPLERRQQAMGWTILVMVHGLW